MKFTFFAIPCIFLLANGPKSVNLADPNIVTVSTTQSPDVDNSTQVLRNEITRELKKFNERLSALEKQNSKTQNYSNCQSELQTLKRELEKLKLEFIPKDCSEIQELGHPSGNYYIQPNRNFPSFMVWCDMTTMGGGWAYVIRRFDGSANFDRNWANYKVTFGYLDGEYWIGLSNLHYLTYAKDNEVLYELVDWDDKIHHAHYKKIKVGKEYYGHPLTVEEFTGGSAGDSVLVHNGAKFSTFDKDQDKAKNRNCAKLHHGGWWYTDCFSHKLTGQYLKGPTRKNWNGIHWYTLGGRYYSLKGAKMMVRPRRD